MRALLKENRSLGNFLISAFPLGLTEFLPYIGLPRPKLQRRHSPMAKVESYRRFGIQRIRPGCHFDIELGEVKATFPFVPVFHIGSLFAGKA
jgi:hypothetical protein